MLGAMNAKRFDTRWVPALGWLLVAALPPAWADATLQGEVTLDYYVADVDSEGFEFVDAEFYAERVQNSDAAATGPLSLWAWLTEDATPEGEGTDVADSSIGTVPGSSSLLDFNDVVPADDAVPGEYYAHVLLQDDDFPGTFEDARTLSPRMLWRGGLEAAGPLDVFPYSGGYRVSVDFAQLRNNRIDSRVTNDIRLTLYATSGFGPASSGHTLCSAVVAGLYAGDFRSQPGFDCTLAAIPDGEYTLHLDVEEIAGRAGYSTLSGPDVRFSGGYMDDGSTDGYVYVSGALAPTGLLPLLLLGCAGLIRRSKSMNTLIKWSAGLLLSLPLAAGAVSRPATPFTDAELDQMLAPIALYPDAVLSHVLIAATVPDDVEAAAEWSRRHPDLSGQAAVNAVESRDWDPSVKALVAFPDVLERMDDDPEWTEDLGEAFLDQEADVMDRVQYLRDRADAEGTLESVEHVRVVREREYIYLEPAVASVVYVPYYDPWFVYGSWWWPYYPPHHWSFWAGYPVHHYHGGAVFYWGTGFRLGPSYYYSRFNWRDRHVVVTRPHRNYQPTPGYSGGSDVRHPRHAERDTRASRRPDSSRRSEWQHDNRRTDRGNNRRTDPPRRDDPPRRTVSPRRDDSPRHAGSRRTWDQVREGLSARREARPSGGARSALEHRASPRHEAPRVSSDRSVSRGRGEVRRETRGPAREEFRRPSGSERGRVEHTRPSRAVESAPRESRGGGRSEGDRSGGREYRQGQEHRPEVQRQGRSNGGHGRRER